MNQNPEQLARDQIDSALLRSGWLIQNKNQVNLQAAIGVAVREYQTNIGPADYVLFVNKQPVGIIEAKREEEGLRIMSNYSYKKVIKDGVIVPNDVYNIEIKNHKRRSKECFGEYNDKTHLQKDLDSFR